MISKCHEIGIDIDIGISAHYQNNPDPANPEFFNKLSIFSFIKK